MNSPTRVKTVPEASYGSEEDHKRRITQAANALQDGQGNNHYIVALDPNETETMFRAPKCTGGSVVTWAARTPEAALHPVLWAIVESPGEVTLFHDVGTSELREFGVVIHG